ncbi:MAG: hypothetical protein ACREDR_35645, partial [Blastocatellia bacterium]
MLAQRSYMSAPTGTEIFAGASEAMYYLASALEEIAEGAIFLNADGQLLWHNRAFDKLMVDNREGHLLVAAVIDVAGELSQDSQKLHKGAAGSESKRVKVGGIA